VRVELPGRIERAVKLCGETVSSAADADAFAAAVDGADPEILTTLGEALSGLRKAKSEAKVKQRTAVRSATIGAAAEDVARLEAGLDDLRAAGNAAQLSLVAGDAGLSVRDVELAPAEEPAR
jgi:valyl-tRNA synthetase